MPVRHSFRAAAWALGVISVLSATVALAAAATGAAPAAAGAGDANAGKAVYKVKCVACHKVDGTGGFKVTGNPTPNWTLKKTWDATRTDAFLRDCIVNGKTKSGMVAWGKTGQLKPAEIDNVIAYVKTFKAAAK